MNIPEFWYRAEYAPFNSEINPPVEGAKKKFKLPFYAWGWSFESIELAEKDAYERLKRILNSLAIGAPPDDYPYDVRALREEIVERVYQEDDLCSMITRNRYGSLVLNSASVMFVDVDIPELNPGLGRPGWFKLLFESRRAREQREKELNTSLEVLEAEATDRVRNWSGRNPGHSIRVYRTHSGLRLLFTGERFKPDSEEVTQIMQGLDADPLYVKLTRGQQCFRARLTPKPWRCKHRNPEPKCLYPRQNEEGERLFQQWLEKYEALSSAYRTCKFLSRLGEDDIIPEAERIIGIHDKCCRVADDLPLA